MPFQRGREFATSIEDHGPVSPSLIAGDFAIALWLGFAFPAFTDRPQPGGAYLALTGMAVALLACLLRWHQRPSPHFRIFVTKGAVIGATLAATLYGVRSLVYPTLTLRECLWVGTATALLLTVLRLAHFAFRNRQPSHPLEMLRWIALASVAFSLCLPYYYSGGLGSGDAHWYATMLADFLTQVRSGIFPVWVGQSEFAFNGADSPLRFAPWFQYAGGLVDLLTCHALTPLAVKNAVLALNGFAGAFVSYACLRDILPRRPGTAMLLAAIYTASPAYLAAVCLGDQYMTYLTLPYIPVVLNGLWRALVRNDSSGDSLIAVGLAALWLSHPPIAMWTTLVAGFSWVTLLLRRPPWVVYARRTAQMAVLFLALGSLTFLSVFSLDNKLPAGGAGGSVAQQVAAHFPGNFLPVNLQTEVMRAYQVGYAALLALALALIGWLLARPRGLGAFFSSILLIALLALPVPWINSQFWNHAPGWLIDINNVWPTQRLFGLWGALMLFTFAMVYANERFSQSVSLSVLSLTLLLGASVWSGRESVKYVQALQSGRVSAAIMASRMDPRNAILTRYAYSSFSYMPAYASHAYMDPYLENRLLSKEDESILIANADAAAPLIRTEFGSSHPSRLVSSGVLLARSVANTPAYSLAPNFPLQPGRHYALRLEFYSPETFGQLICNAGSLHRDYLLPDSGRGLNGNAPPRSFGSTPTSSHIISFQLTDPHPSDLHMDFIAQGRARADEYNFARYWLYTYDPVALPIELRSLMPYQAKVDAAMPVYLETPRMWLHGYQATVNGLPVNPVRSRRNLVMVPLAPGVNEVTLSYRPSWWLTTSFWIAMLGWIGLACRGFWRLLRMAQNRQTAV